MSSVSDSMASSSPDAAAAREAGASNPANHDTRVATAALAPSAPQESSRPAGRAVDHVRPRDQRKKQQQQQQQQPQPQPQPQQQQQQKQQQPCRFYGTKNGCRAASHCPYLHDAARLPTIPTDASVSASGASASSSLSSSSSSARVDQPRQGQESQNARRRFAQTDVDASRVVQRPMPRAQTENPRDFQLRQIRRKFRPEEKSDSLFILHLKPSDPDFPFDVVALDCALTVPLNYPVEKPSLRVRNKEMDRGYQINIEQGFDRILAKRPTSNLLQVLNLLDRELESLLSAPKAETIKLVANLGKAPRFEAPRAETANPPVSSQAVNTGPPVPKYSQEDKEAAAKLREREARQLEARLGRLPLFNKSSDGLSYVVPIEPRKREELPTSLKAVKSVRLHVPLLYDLEPCSINLVGVDGEEALNVESAFTARSLQSPRMSLVNLVNLLSSDMCEMAKLSPNTKKQIVDQDMQQSSATLTEVKTLVEKQHPPQASFRPGFNLAAEDDDNNNNNNNNKSHIITIPRPPEWVVVDHEEAEDSYDSYSYDTGDETEDDGDAMEEQPKDDGKPTSVAERGITISLPHLELRSVELLELVSLNLTVKCDRCKEIQDVTNIKNNDKADHSGVRSLSCKKCANSLAIGYRMDTMHVNSVRAGSLELEACAVVDLLPSSFVPTCSECSTPYAAPGITSVRGDASLAICRECHGKMTFKIVEVRFLQVSAGVARAGRAPPRKKRTERLGIVAGTELPRRGRCKHYGKSYRWFRFSCCERVYACDRCHDAEADHANEHARRMICGFCSREQNYRPEDCGVCRSTLTGKAGSGFWEGGKGTRDRLRMSRKDPRKYKRRHGTSAKA